MEERKERKEKKEEDTISSFDILTLLQLLTYITFHFSPQPKFLKVTLKKNFFTHYPTFLYSSACT